MDNTTEDNFGKQENTVYSSQDILGNSLAGKKRQFFTRVKETRASSEKSPRRPKKISKKQVIIAAIVATAVVILTGGALIMVLVMNNSSNDSPDPAPVEGNEAYKDEVIPEEVATLKPDPTDGSISLNDYASAQVKYVNALVDNNLLRTAMNEMESIMSEVEMNLGNFSDCELAAIRRASLRIQETDIAARRAAGEDVADPNTEEDENTGIDEDGEQPYTDQVIDRMKQAMEVCGE